MKKVIYALLASALMMGMTACSSNEKKHAVKLTTMQPESAKPTGPERMQVSNATATFAYLGKNYSTTVVRRPDDALSMVKDGEGNLHVDNRITLQLKCGGRMVLNKTFTKESFSAYVDADFLKHALLEGLVFDQTTDRGMTYVASVAYPQTDLFIPLRLIVSPNGSVVIERDTLLEEYH